MATAHTSLCIYLKKEINPDPQIVRGLIEQGADPFELVGGNPNEIRYSTMTMITRLPNGARLFRLLASLIDMRGRLQVERFSFQPNFILEVCWKKNRELFTETIPYLVGTQVLFCLPMDPWYWTEFMKRHTVDFSSLTDARHYEYDVLAHALEKDASMEMLRFLARYIQIDPRKRFSNAYGYLEIACVFGSFEAVKWLVEEHGCRVYAHDDHGNPLCAMADIDVRFIPDLLNHDYDVHLEAERKIMQVSRLTNRLFPLLAAVDSQRFETVLPKVTYLLKNGALCDLNRRFYREDLYDEWHAVPHPLKLATQLNLFIRSDVCLELLKHGAIPTQDILDKYYYCRKLLEIVQDAINEYVCLGYFFLTHGADDTKAKRQRSNTVKLPNVLYKTIGSFLLCASSKEYICLSRCLNGMALAVSH
jgi:hypothetical protein